MTAEDSVLVPLPLVRSTYFMARERGLAIDEALIVETIQQQAKSHGDIMFVNPQEVITELAQTANEQDRKGVYARIPLTVALEIATLLPPAVAAHQPPETGEGDSLPFVWSGEASNMLNPAEAAAFMETARTSQPLTADAARKRMREIPELAHLSGLSDEPEAHIRISVYAQAVQALISGAMSLEQQPLSNRMQEAAAVLEQTVSITH